MSRIAEFINAEGNGTAHVPFMPIMMRFCAKFTNTAYRDFILDPEAHCDSNIRCAEAFHSDWVNVMSDPYCELSAYGGQVEYPADSLPVNCELRISSLQDMARITRIAISDSERGRGRLRQLEIFRQRLDGQTAICGWAEGAVAEYCDLRGLAESCLDFFDAPDTVNETLNILAENAMDFVKQQIDAGADMIGIGDAVCSQLGPELYEQFGFQYEKRLVDWIHRNGALAKLHICGNTSAILPRMIETGADIIDVDHLVGDMKPYIPLLSARQVLCGNLDPVSVVQDCPPEEIEQACRDILSRTGNKLILSAGCEITPDTPDSHLAAMHQALTDR